MRGEDEGGRGGRRAKGGRGGGKRRGEEGGGGRRGEEEGGRGGASLPDPTPGIAPPSDPGFAVTVPKGTITLDPAAQISGGKRRRGRELGCCKRPKPGWVGISGEVVRVDVFGQRRRVLPLPKRFLAAAGEEAFIFVKGKPQNRARGQCRRVPAAGAPAISGWTCGWICVRSSACDHPGPVSPVMIMTRVVIRL